MDKLPETLHEKEHLLKQLSIDQLSCIFKSFPKDDPTLSYEDVKIKILDMIATESNIREIEQIVLS
jgi:hypothetical protein